MLFMLIRYRVINESGVMCYEYGNMGEVTKETRIYALPFLSQPLALSTLFEYDSWGRILNITYPDNEIVNYDYDLGGQLFRMYNVQLTMYNYLDSIKYDKFGAKISQKYGNGIKTALTTMEFDGYTVNIQFEWKEVDIGNATGEDAIKIIQSAANADPIGNSIVHDEMVSDAAIVSGSKHLSANMIKAGHDKYVFFGINGTATHEIGHFFGLRDRYSSSNSEHAPYIKGDLMSSDLYRDNAVAPFIRVMNYNNLTPGTSKSVLINKNNKEAK